MYMIGLITEDLFVTLNPDLKGAAVVSRIGGILHAAVATAIHGYPTSLVSAVGTKSLGQLRSFDSIPALDLSSVSEQAHSTPRCCLFWTPEAREPVEQTTTHGRSITLSTVLKAIGSSRGCWLYVNFTVGHDLELPSLQRLAAADHRIYLDPHLLLYRRDASGARLLYPPDDWELWLGCADCIQLNTVEFESIFSRTRLSAKTPRSRLKSFHEYLRRRSDRIQIVIVTGSSRVLWSWWLDKDHIVGAEDVSTQEIPEQAYSIGCGDVFGAGVFSSLHHTADLPSLRKGIALGMAWAREAAGTLGVTTNFTS